MEGDYADIEAPRNPAALTRASIPAILAASNGGGNMKALRVTLFGLALAVLSACAGAYVAGDAGEHHPQLTSTAPGA
jgi:hypothetical protein